MSLPGFTAGSSLAPTSTAQARHRMQGSLDSEPLAGAIVPQQFGCTSCIKPAPFLPGVMFCFGVPIPCF